MGERNVICSSDGNVEEPLSPQDGGASPNPEVPGATGRRILRRVVGQWHTLHPVWAGVVVVLVALVLALAVAVAVLSAGRCGGDPAVPAALVLACPDDWVGYRNVCYSFSRAEGSWEWSQEQCSSQGASLAMPRREWEMEFLWSQKAHVDCWLGLRRRGERLQWVDGSSFNQRPLPWRGSSRSWRRATDLCETGLADGWIDTRGARGTAGRSSPAMAEEITYADLAIGPGNRRRDLHSLPQPGASGCPQWHRTALWTGWTGNLLLGVAVVAMGCSLLHQQSENPGSRKNVSGNVGDGNIIPQNACSELREALCSSKPQEGAGCKLCPMNWTLRGTKCYWESSGINPWNVSREVCANRGAELLLLEDQDELDFLNKTLQKPTSYFWIGLYAGKGWTWLNGSRLDPSRFPLSPPAEGVSCGVIKEGRISSESCGSTSRWICQKKATQL
ncbi:uncharacterized protein LOC141735186 [Larus michahellis]|uniref:uncharacterized protein LOC141735186 n=1 Tax=Larus michahellis TaxID=119627 RepID=UPI003D9B307C